MSKITNHEEAWKYRIFSWCTKIDPSDPQFGTYATVVYDCLPQGFELEGLYSVEAALRNHPKIVQNLKGVMQRAATLRRQRRREKVRLQQVEKELLEGGAAAEAEAEAEELGRKIEKKIFPDFSCMRRIVNAAKEDAEDTTAL